MVYLHKVRETHWVRQNPLHFWQRSNYCTIRVPAQRTSQFIDSNLQQSTEQLHTVWSLFSILPARVVLRHLNQQVEYEAGQLALVHHRLTRGQ